MAYFDLPLDELRVYKPSIPKPGNFDSFWKNTIAESRSLARDPQFEPQEWGFPLLDVYDVSFSGFAGQSIKAWYIRPKNRENLPVVVSYVGYGGGRSLPVDHLRYPAAGYGVFVMDTRGQGSVWSQGDTPDLDGGSGSPQIPGFMTRGILNPADYYYRRVFTDALLALEAAARAPGADSRRLVVGGGSQGGGIAIAAAGLAALCGLPRDVDQPRGAMPDVPFLCNFQRAVGLVDSDPYGEIRRFCVTHRNRIDQAFETLSYFDGLHFAAQAAVPALFSVGLMDTICPPSTVFAAFNTWAGSKQMVEYPYNDHEGGGSHHFSAQLQFLSSVVG